MGILRITALVAMVLETAISLVRVPAPLTVLLVPVAVRSPVPFISQTLQIMPLHIVSALRFNPKSVLTFLQLEPMECRLTMPGIHSIVRMHKLSWIGLPKVRSKMVQHQRQLPLLLQHLRLHQIWFLPRRVFPQLLWVPLLRHLLIISPTVAAKWRQVVLQPKLERMQVNIRSPQPVPVFRWELGDVRFQ